MCIYLKVKVWVRTSFQRIFLTRAHDFSSYFRVNIKQSSSAHNGLIGSLFTNTAGCGTDAHWLITSIQGWNMDLTFYSNLAKCGKKWSTNEPKQKTEVCNMTFTYCDVVKDMCCVSKIDIKCLYLCFSSIIFTVLIFKILK